MYLRSIGYEFEWHEFRTGDGVTIRLHHFWKGNSNETGIPILLTHALMTNGDSWFLGEPKDAFALLLADCGYDMWAINFRGSKYSLVGKYDLSYT